MCSPAFGAESGRLGRRIETADNGSQRSKGLAMAETKGLEQYLEREALGKRMQQVKHKVLVLSGKGGVGKSTVAANLAVSLALAGQRVGLLDIDIHGPSIPKLLGLEGRSIGIASDTLSPVLLDENLKVMSIGFLLRGADDAVIWRGPMKMGVIKQFLKDVEWGELDYLVVDSPPGTGDEPLSICQLIPDADGAIIVTTPQEMAVIDVRKCISFCRTLNMPVLGVVENMSGFVCPKCGDVTEIFGRGGGEIMALETGVPFLGRIPIDPQIVEACDAGKPYVRHYARSETAKAFARVVRPVLGLATAAPPVQREPEQVATTQEEEGTMRIAIPVAGGKLAMHFGHCEEFALIDVDGAEKAIVSRETVAAPDHQPGLLPRWLAERGANMIIAGGMGARAQGLFAQEEIDVLVGAPAEEPESIVNAYLAGTLQRGQNVCDH